jgi:hypothetical protein
MSRSVVLRTDFYAKYFRSSDVHGDVTHPRRGGTRIVAEEKETLQSWISLFRESYVWRMLGRGSADLEVLEVCPSFELVPIYVKLVVSILL